MTDRDRLIELIQKEVPRPKADALAYHLLANGVVLLDFAVVTPENRPLITQIANMPLNEVCELIKAKQEGRTITPPCKVGDRYVMDTAKTIFNAWNDVTGAVVEGTSWYYELESVIEDIVKLSFGAGVLYREEAEAELQKRGVSNAEI